MAWAHSEGNPFEKGKFLPILEAGINEVGFSLPPPHAPPGTLSGTTHYSP